MSQLFISGGQSIGASALASVLPMNIQGWLPLALTGLISFKWCCCSVAQSRPTLCDPMDCSSLGFPVLHRLPEFTQTHIHWVGDAIQPSCTLSSPSPPGFNHSQHQGLFQLVISHIRWPRYWSFSFSFSISPSNGYSGLISFRIDWFDLLLSKGLSRIFSNPQFKIISHSVLLL